MHKWKGPSEFPTVITIFSAANYCDSYNNKGAIIKFENNSLNIQQYKNNPHPYCLPEFMNAIGWSIPFLCEKATEIFLFILSIQGEGKSTPIIPNEDVVMKHKVAFLGKLMAMYKTIREENELILKLKSLSNSKKLPPGTLLSGKQSIIDAIEKFAEMKKLDNGEKRPSYS